MDKDIILYNKYLSNDPQGLKWFENEKISRRSPIIRALIAMTTEPLIPQADNFTPPRRTPWGGTEIIENYKAHLGIASSDVVGESWEISGHPSFPNIFSCDYSGTTLKVPISVLSDLAPNDLYGKYCDSMPFLVKILNSGSWKEYRDLLHDKIAPNVLEKNNHDLHIALSDNNDPTIRDIHTQMLAKNLSVQVHPKKGDFIDKPSKTEAWVILDAEEGAGIYLGLRQGITKEQFEIKMREGKDLTPLLNFIEVTAGDVYFIPAGTLHAIGAGLTLLEPQETSETTFRAYDWGRISNGKPRQLHLDETMTSTIWNGDRSTEQYKKQPHTCHESEGSSIVETLVEEKEFKLTRITLDPSHSEYFGDSVKTGIQGLVITEGDIELHAKNYSRIFKKGQSIMIPAGLGMFSIIGTNSTLLQITA